MRMSQCRLRRALRREPHRISQQGEPDEKRNRAHPEHRGAMQQRAQENHQPDANSDVDQAAQLVCRPAASPRRFAPARADTPTPGCVLRLALRSSSSSRPCSRPRAPPARFRRRWPPTRNVNSATAPTARNTKTATPGASNLEETSDSPSTCRITAFTRSDIAPCRKRFRFLSRISENPPRKRKCNRFSAGSVRLF